MYGCICCKCVSIVGELLSHVQDKAGALPSLVMLCGDHGMSDHGGHGGSTPSETGTPLLFISSAFQQGRGT